MSTERQRTVQKQYRQMNKERREEYRQRDRKRDEQSKKRCVKVRKSGEKVMEHGPIAWANSEESKREYTESVRQERSVYVRMCAYVCVRWENETTPNLKKIRTFRDLARNHRCNFAVSATDIENMIRLFEVKLIQKLHMWYAVRRKETTKNKRKRWWGKVERGRTLTLLLCEMTIIPYTQTENNAQLPKGEEDVERVKKIWRRRVTRARHKKR